MKHFIYLTIITVLSIWCFLLNVENSSNQKKIFWNEKDLDFLRTYSSELRRERSGLEIEVEYYKSEIKRLR